MDEIIENEYGYTEDYSYLNKIISLTLKKEKVKKGILSIVFVGEEKIREINRTYRGIDRITDVISFAFEEAKNVVSLNCRFLGEIYICIPRMEKQAKEYGHSTKRELSFLVVHGILHLLGYDHIEPEEEKVMFARQEMILNAAGIKRC